MPKKATVDLSALDGLSMDNLLSGPSAGSEQPQGQGKPLEIPLDDIIEDPDQPRKTFDQESLKELAESIKHQGLLMPIAVRPRPDGQPGYMIIAGARRYRASRLAGKNTIPAFLGGDAADKYAQMAENIHRDNLSHTEIAAFIAGELSQGKKQVQIAQALGKNKSYVSRYVALAEAPDWIKTMVADGRCKDINTISAIVKRAEKDKDLDSKLANETDITKATLAALDVSTGQASTPEPSTGRAQEPQAWSLMDAAAVESHEQGNQGAEVGQDQPDFTHLSADSAFVPQESQGMDVGQNATSGSDYKEPTDSEPNKAIIVYVGGRRGFLQSKKLKICFEDNGEIANVASEDVSFQ